MKKLYFTLLFLVFGFLVSAQTSTEVGVTEGQLSVSLSGAANYTIPIAVPSGINGIVPQIGLEYNSQGDNGIAGYGWNISGLSSIKRIPSTKFHDGISDAVDFDNLDRFSLDGQRLIVKNGNASSYGLTGTVYETENFSNVRVTSYGVHSSGTNYGPAYFLVEYPDGSKALYGNSTDSRSITDWAITYWENAQGVRINYSYSLTNNILNIASIKYGGRLDSTPMNEIQFVYKTRQREEQSYVGGQFFIKNKILSDIKVLGNGIGFRNYSLAYDVTSLFYERLISITEKSGDNSKSYNPTIFEYENTTETISMQDSFTSLSVNPTPFMPEGHIVDNTAENGGDDSKIVGDFGMDNKFGLITFSSNVQKRSNYIFYSNIDSNTTSAVGTKIYTKSIFDEIFLVNTLSGDASGYKLKQNQNWCIARTDHESNLTTFSVFSNNPDGNSPIKMEHEINYTFPMYINELIGGPKKAIGAIKTYLSGDFNGDNITDAIIIECGISRGNDPTPTYLPNRIPKEGDIAIAGGDTSGGGVYFVNLDPRVTSNAVNFAGRLSGEFRRNVSGAWQSSFFAADVNGDGKTDIVVTTKNIIDIYSLNENNIFVKIETITLQMDNYGSIYNSSFALADYNGDGKVDYGPNLFSNGVSFVPNSTPTFYSAGAIGNYIDFTNDGITDRFSSFVSTGMVKFSSQINLFPLASKVVVYDYYFNQKTGYSYNNIYNKNTLSKNQVALYEYAGNVNPKTLRYLTINKDLRKEKLLKSITLGNGVKQSITYSPLINGNGVYTASPLTENYPNQDIVNAPELKVVSKIEKQSKSQYKKQLFFYSGAVTNLEGLGFLGFYSTVKTNWHDDNSPIISYLSKNDLSLRGANVENYEILGLYEPLERPSTQTLTTIVKKDKYTVTGTENLVATQSIILKPDTHIMPGSDFSAKINREANTSSVNTPTSFITKSLLTYESDLLSNNVFKIKNISNKEFNGLENTSNETTLEYDEYNNPVKNSTTVREGSSLVQTSISDIVYENNASPYIVGRPISKMQNVTLGTDKMTKEELYHYNSNQLLSQVEKKGDATTNYITEDNVYDAFGNIIKNSIKAGSDTRETSYEYDPSGRFLTKNIDINKLVTTYEYNTNGTLKYRTNPFGQRTKYDYDTWFKKIKETYYLSSTTTNITTFSYINSSGYTDITKTSPGEIVINELYDDLGRKIRTGSKNIMGSYTYISYQYDIHDRNYKVSEPYIGTAPSLWNETKYDDYGHISETVSAAGKTTNIVTTGLTTTVNDGVKTTTYVKNALGNVVSMYDVPNNNIKYTYFANGELKQSDYGGVKTTITQDGWGRKIQIEDPSAGIFKYKYNDFGDLIREENKNGITSYKVSSTGKIDEKTISGINTNSKTTYTYNANQLISNIKFEDFTNGTNFITTEYIYDQSQRVSKKVETTPYAVFTKDYTYTFFEKLYTETFTASRGGKSSSKEIKYVYQYGYPFQINDGNGTLLWQTTTVNAFGQLLEARNGPSGYITNNYDIYGYPKESKIYLSKDDLLLSTNFDIKKGNLINRTNSLFAWKEEFKYDNLDRLTDYTNRNGINETQAYDDKGRITQNILGTYSYAKSNPYQNEAIALSPEALDYYTTKPLQIIDYNVFKSPVLINEKDVDKVSFDYNSSNARTAVFYGGLQEEKLKRPYHKYYSEDGSMEIKENTATGVLDFVTYIGGDGYTAPVVFKSDGIGDSKYLFLQRDYQSSIIAITDIEGVMIEKRLFDAWGNITKVQDGAGNTLAGLTVLDRGYTGHEHLQSVGLINMNGRVYDPKLHRFLQPDNNIQDPFNTQNYNRYGYVVNNPLKYTDPSGEIFGFVLGAIFSTYVRGGAASGGETNPFKWNSSTWINALSGTASSVASYNATTGINSYTDNYNNKPALGASATGQWDNVNSFVGSNQNNLWKNEAFTGKSEQNNESNFSKEFLGLSVGVVSESKFGGRYYFKDMENTFFNVGNISKFGAYGGTALDLYDIGAGFYKVSTASSNQERTDASNSLAFDGLLIGVGRKWPIAGLAIGIGKVVSTTEVYKQGMIDGRNSAFIQKNGYPVNHTASIRSDSGMYRECETCPLKFK